MPPINSQSGQAQQKKSSVDIIKSVLMRAGTIWFEPVKTLGLASGGAVSVSFTNQDNIPFLIQKIVGYARNLTTFEKAFDYSVAFKDSGRSQLLMQNAMHGSALGSGDFPSELAVPYLIKGSASMSIEIANLGLEPLDVHVTFIGYKIANISM